MKIFVGLLFLIFVVKSQPNDQAIIAEFHPTFATILMIKAAVVVDDFNPLRIQITNDGLLLRVIEFTVPDERPDPVVIEVFHPEIIQRFPRVVWINFQRVGMRRIGEFSFTTCGNIRTIFFDYNFIEEIPAGTFRNCPNLNWMKLRFNRIKKLNPESFEGLLNMKDLELEGNQISSISAEDFKFLPELRTLWISRNPLKTISAQSFPNYLMGLDLIDCQISELPADTFSNLTMLTYINLSKNPITDLPPGIFSNLKLLFNLFLDSTNIRRLSSDSFSYHEAFTELHIQSAALDEIQIGFFDAFPFINLFDARNNSCTNVTLSDVRSIDFFEDSSLNECFANWFVPRETTTVMSVNGGEKVGKSLWVIVMVSIKILLT